MPRAEFNEDEVRVLKLVKTVGTAIGGLILAGVLLSGVYTVDEGQRAVQTRMGAVVGYVGPGPHFKMPIIEGARKFEVRTQTIKWRQEGNEDSRMQSYSFDQQPADISITVLWSVLDDEKSIRKVYAQYGSVENIRNSLIIPSATEGVKNIFGRYTSVSAIQDRPKLNAEVFAEVQKLTKNLPVRIQSVQIQDIAFSNAYETAVEERMTAQVEVEKKEQKKRTAQLDADMQVISAEADAAAIKLAGEAEASAIEAKARALAANQQLVGYTLAQKWDGVLPTTMVPGGGVPMLNLPSK